MTWLTLALQIVKSWLGIKEKQQEQLPETRDYQETQIARAEYEQNQKAINSRIHRNAGDGLPDSPSKNGSSPGK